MKVFCCKSFIISTGYAQALQFLTYPPDKFTIGHILISVDDSMELFLLQNN